MAGSKETQSNRILAVSCVSGTRVKTRERREREAAPLAAVAAGLDTLIQHPNSANALEDRLGGVERLAAIEHDQAKVSAVGVDDRCEKVGGNGHQSVRGVAVVAGEEKHATVVHLQCEQMQGRQTTRACSICSR